jgi:hypothetical protein
MGLGLVNVHSIGQSQGAVEGAGVALSHQVIAFSVLALLSGMALNHQDIVLNRHVNIFGINSGQGGFNNDVVPFLDHV